MRELIMATCVSSDKPHCLLGWAVTLPQEGPGDSLWLRDVACNWGGRNKWTCGDPALKMGESKHLRAGAFAIQVCDRGCVRSGKEESGFSGGKGDEEGRSSLGKVGHSPSSFEQSTWIPSASHPNYSFPKSEFFSLPLHYAFLICMVYHRKHKLDGAVTQKCRFLLVIPHCASSLSSYIQT